MFPIALGYLGLSTPDIDDWRSYGSRLLGLQPVDKTAKTLGFRMDERAQRFCVEADGRQGVKYFGWEVADAASLSGMAKRLEDHKISVAAGSRALADERQVKDLIVFSDPLGNRVELFHTATDAKTAFQPGRTLSGFRTQAVGLGHIVLTCENIDAIAPFYEDVMGFGLSDYYSEPFAARFLHVNERHHSLAFVETGKTGIHHMMVETLMFDDVGQALDIANAEQGRVAVTLGRHAGDCMTSFYTWTPSGFICEYGWGGESIDPTNWVPFERTQGPSLWGHDRAWLPPDRQLAARAMRMRNAQNGVQRPVQVLDGNYERMKGACPWWDRMGQANGKVWPRG